MAMPGRRRESLTNSLDARERTLGPATIRGRMSLNTMNVTKKLWLGSCRQPCEPHAPK